MTVSHSTGVDNGNVDLQIERVYEAANEAALTTLLASKCKPGHIVRGSWPHSTGFRVMLSYNLTEDGTVFIVQNAGASVNRDVEFTKASWSQSWISVIVSNGTVSHSLPYNSSFPVVLNLNPLTQWTLTMTSSPGRYLHVNQVIYSSGQYTFTPSDGLTLQIYSDWDD